MPRTDPFTSLLIGDSLPMRLIYGLMETAARTSVPVVLQGETGTGKELVAKGIHEASARKEKPFVPLNCAALPEPLLESLLFGHRKGSFTGAERDQRGAFQTADTGTILLDEIGDMPISIQAKFLRVLQNGEVVPIGQQRPEAERVDVRIIAATNRTLVRDVGTTFRADLYYRLAVLTIDVPPLRQRVTDIAPLAAMFLNRYGRLCERRLNNTLGPEALAALAAYPWPGNVRELENEIARAVAIAGDGAMICREQLAPHIRQDPGPVIPDLSPLVDAVIAGRLTFDEALAGVERALINRAMGQAGGVFTHAAELLGTTRKRLGYLLLHRFSSGESETLATQMSDLEWRTISEALAQTKGNNVAEAARALGVKRTTLVAKIRRYRKLHPDAP